MIDQNFIGRKVARGEEALERVRANFGNLTVEQINWKPAKERWSIAECLEHLLIADKCYFKDLAEISNGSYEMTFWEKYSPFSSLLGNLLKENMKEKVKRKMVTQKMITPLPTTYDISLLSQYAANLTRFIDLVSKCAGADLDRTIIGSPMIGWVTYSLRDALEFLFEHEHRHINQAIEVMRDERFPKAERENVKWESSFPR